MSNEHNDDLDPDFAIQAARLLVSLRQIRAENGRLHERVKDLERQLADAYARIAEMAKGPTITTDSIWPPPTLCTTLKTEPAPGSTGEALDELKGFVIKPSITSEVTVDTRNHYSKAEP